MSTEEEDAEDLYRNIRDYDNQLSTRELQQEMAQDLGWDQEIFYLRLRYLVDAKRIYQLNGKWTLMH